MTLARSAGGRARGGGDPSLCSACYRSTISLATCSPAGFFQTVRSIRTQTTCEELEVSMRLRVLLQIRND